jgi:hypothetical protein
VGQCLWKHRSKKRAVNKVERDILTTRFTRFPYFYVEINLRHDSGVHRVRLSQLVSAIVNICLPETRMERRRDEGCNRDARLHPQLLDWNWWRQPASPGAFCLPHMRHIYIHTHLHKYACEHVWMHVHVRLCKAPKRSSSRWRHRLPKMTATAIP